MKEIFLLLMSAGLIIMAFLLGKKQQQVQDYETKYKTYTYMCQVVADINSMSNTDISKLYDAYEL